MKQYIFNPPYFDGEEFIQLAAFYHPNPNSIVTAEQWAFGVERRYLEIAERAYANKKIKPYLIYNEFIDENPFVDDAKSLVACLMQSDKYKKVYSYIQECIAEKIVAENNFTNREVEDLIDGIELFDLLQLFDWFS